MAPEHDPPEHDPPEYNPEAGWEIRRPSELAAALAKVQAELPRVEKRSKADTGSYTYDYAELSDVAAAIMPALGRNGLAFTAWPTMQDGRFVLHYALIHASGEERTGTYPLPDKGTPQQLGGHITYARRYALCAVTGVAPGGDDSDGAGTAEVQMDRPAANGHTDDPWQDQPPGELPTEPEQRSGSLDGRQRSQIFAKFKVLGVGDATEQRAVLKEILRRDVSSRKGLSFVDAETVLKDLQTRVEAKEAAEEAQAAAEAQDDAEVDAP